MTGWGGSKGWDGKAGGHVKCGEKAGDWNGLDEKAEGKGDWMGGRWKDIGRI